MPAPLTCAQSRPPQLLLKKSKLDEAEAREARGKLRTTVSSLEEALERAEAEATFHRDEAAAALALTSELKEELISVSEQLSEGQAALRAWQQQAQHPSGPCHDHEAPWTSMA